MANERISVSGNINARLSGERWAVVAVSTIWTALMLSGIYLEMRQKNEIERRKVEIMSRQADVMQRQYVLDSLKFSQGR